MVRGAVLAAGSTLAEQLFTATYIAVIVGIVGLGLFIGYQAYRGFRRHESGPMRYLSMGLILLTAVAASLAFGDWIAWRLELISEDTFWGVHLVYRLTQFAGLAFIAYSLYKRP